MLSTLLPPLCLVFGVILPIVLALLVVRRATRQLAVATAYREIPPKYTQDGQGGKEWNSIVPMNVGLAYQLHASKVVKPYFGADFIFAQYYRDPDTKESDWSLGGRVRVGANFMVSRIFGINANLGMGYWADDQWVIIQRDMKSGGVLFQASAGVTFAI